MASPAASIQPSLLRIQRSTFISCPIFFLTFCTLGHFLALHLRPLQGFFFLVAVTGSSIISTASSPVVSVLKQLSIAALSLAPMPVPAVQARATSPSSKYSPPSGLSPSLGNFPEAVAAIKRRPRILILGLEFPHT